MQAICYNFEKRRADLFQDYANVMRFNLVPLCPSMLLFFSFAVFPLCCSTVLSCYCILRFGHSGKKKERKATYSVSSLSSAGALIGL